MPEPPTVSWRSDLPDGERAVVRLYRRGRGLHLLRRLGLRLGAQREHDTLVHLERAGVPCTPPLYWTEGWTRDYGTYDLVATREIRDAKTLHRYLATAPPQTVHPALRRLFRLLRKMHRCGVHHGALEPDNILVGLSDRDGVECYIKDLSRSLVFPFDISGTRMAEWDLLHLTYVLVRRLGFPSHRVPLEAYGFDGFEAAELVSRMYSFRRSLLLDRLARAEWIFRLWAARIRALGLGAQRQHRTTESLGGLVE